MLRDHPRRCGENLSALFLMTACTGSPPQVRGKPFFHSFTPYTTRITPAGAGKTQRRNEHIGAHWDHPRRCGENLSALEGLE